MWARQQTNEQKPAINLCHAEYPYGFITMGDPLLIVTLFSYCHLKLCVKIESGFKISTACDHYHGISTTIINVFQSPVSLVASLHQQPGLAITVSGSGKEKTVTPRHTTSHHCCTKSGGGLSNVKNLAGLVIKVWKTDQGE